MEKKKKKHPKSNNLNFGHVPKGQNEPLKKNETHPKINNLNFGHVQGPKKILIMHPENFKLFIIHLSIKNINILRLIYYHKILS
jgi:hypothetical protein